MNEIEKQILRNQLIIIGSQNELCIEDEEFKLNRFNEICKTEKLLNPKQTDSSACDMEEEESRE